jgi:hypothetical protein
VIPQNSPIRPTEDGPEVYGVLFEGRNQGPILMETEGPTSSREAAQEKAEILRARPDVLRVCIVRLTYEGHGNELLLHDMERMQK